MVKSKTVKRKNKGRRFLIIWAVKMNEQHTVFNQGGFMGAATNVRDFPTAEREPAELSGWDRFLIWAGAKRMANTPKTSMTTPLEYNKSVLGLAATLIALVAVLVGIVWNYAAMTTKFEMQQQKILLLESEIKDVKTEINRFKEFQIKADSYRLGLADAHGSEKEKK